jgi:hypothetical protein
MWVSEWASDQFLPAIRDASLVYRKFHAYAFIAESLAHKDILEIAGGDVSGSGILARDASSVVSLVVDETLARCAGERFGKPNLQFQPLRPAELLANHAGQFDAVVSLNGLGAASPAEPEFLTTLKRLLKKNGVLVVSSGETENIQSLMQWLGPHFRSIEVLGQGIFAGSAIWPVANSQGATSSLLMSRDKNGDIRVARGHPDSPLNLIAIASDGGPLTRDTGSVLLDAANELLEDKDKAASELLKDGISRMKSLEQAEQQLAERRESLASLQESFAWQKSEIDALTKTQSFLQSEIQHYRNALTSNENALNWRATIIRDLEAGAVSLQEAVDWYKGNLERAKGELRVATERLQETLQQLGAATEELHGIKTRGGWVLILRVRALRENLLPRGSAADRLYQRLMSFSRLRGGK